MSEPVRGARAAPPDVAMIKLSKHTADEMGGRSILIPYIEAALASPDHVVWDPTDP
jgi:hypothetical protein